MDADGADIAREREKSFRERPFLYLTKMEAAPWVRAKILTRPRRARAAAGVLKDSKRTAKLSTATSAPIFRSAYFAALAQTTTAPKLKILRELSELARQK